MAEELDLYKKFHEANESIHASTHLSTENKKLEYAEVMKTYKKAKSKLRRDAKLAKLEEKKARVAAGGGQESKAMRIEAEGLPDKKYVLYAKFNDAIEARAALRALFDEKDGWLTPLCGRSGGSYLCAYHCTETSVSDPPLAFKITSPAKAGPGYLYVWEDNADNDKVANFEGTLSLDDGEETDGESHAEIFERFKKSELLEQNLAHHASTTFLEVLKMDDDNLNKVEEAMLKMSMGTLKMLSTELQLSVDTQGSRLAKKHIVTSLFDALGDLTEPAP